MYIMIKPITLTELKIEFKKVGNYEMVLDLMLYYDQSVIQEIKQILTEAREKVANRKQ